MISRLDHFTIAAADLGATERFYGGLLGMKVGPRPAFERPGLWLYPADLSHPIVHVVTRRTSATLSRVPVDHIAFFGSGLQTVLIRVRDAAWPARLERQVGTQVWQLFLNDPDGTLIEIDFNCDEDPGDER